MAHTKQAEAQQTVSLNVGLESEEEAQSCHLQQMFDYVYFL